MKTEKYDEATVVKQLQKKHDIQIKGNVISVLSGNSAKGDIGIHSKGKIDFLTKYRGYFFTFTSKF